MDVVAGWLASRISVSLALLAAATPAAIAQPAPVPAGFETPFEEGEPSERKTIAGFRMEGDPMIETVFGDTVRFKKYIDRFYDVHEAMRSTRAGFYRQVQATLATLGAHPRGRCPEDAVAPLYARA